MRKTLMGLLAVFLLSGLGGCVSTVVLLADKSNGDPVSGHTIGTSKPLAIVDFGEIRVRVANVQSVRNFPIPTSRVFRFSWTPEAYNSQLAAKGLRPPTDADWTRRAQQRIAMAKGDPNAANMIKAVPRLIAYERRQFERSDFRPHVTRDGQIARCNDTHGGKFGCTIGLELSKEAQMQLARQALRQVDPKCRIGRVDPTELVENQRPGVKSGPLSVVATVICT